MTTPDTSTFTCPACGTQFPASVLMHPDILEDGDPFTCNCGAEIGANFDFHVEVRAVWLVDHPQDPPMDTQGDTDGPQS